LGNPRAVLAVLGISTDFVVDLEGALLVSKFPGVVLRQTKCALPHEEICASTYIEAFEKGMLQSAVASLKWPLGFNTLWGVGCTSLSFSLGPERCASLFDSSHTDMMAAVNAALLAVSEKKKTRVSVFTPYIDEVHESNLEKLRDAGLDVVASMNLGFTVDMQTSALDPGSIMTSVEKLVSEGPETDIVFIGCSAFRAMAEGFISSLETKLGHVTVITSMQAFFWHMLRTCGIKDQIKGYGKLFSDF
jgi:maleate cis-trans isomerase